MKATIRTVLRDKDDILPESYKGMSFDNYYIFNAARPLHGQITWQGDFIHGVFYAAVDKDFAQSKVIIERNVNLDGHILQFVTESEVREKLQAHYNKIAPGKIDVSKYSIREIWDSYLQYFGVSEIEF